MWHERSSEPWRTATKTFDHPELGPITLDCDSLLMPDADQTVVMYSAAPNTPAAAALDLLRVTGTEHFVAER
ncbi:MmyB family transcriptional regulator [Nocardia xishanensis]